MWFGQSLLRIEGKRQDPIPPNSESHWSLLTYRTPSGTDRTPLLSRHNGYELVNGGMVPLVLYETRITDVSTRRRQGHDRDLDHHRRLDTSETETRTRPGPPVSRHVGDREANETKTADVTTRRGQRHERDRNTTDVSTRRTGVSTRRRQGHERHQGHHRRLDTSETKT